nr:retrovirus-related Pol polyprotein from transposon TNT 1-94 [Tanacetum cinerariifolium]
MKKKGDECIFVGYSTQSKAYRMFNKRTRVIMESIHVNFDELPLMASDQLSSDPTPECQTMALDQNSFDSAPECQTMASDQNSSDPAPECQTTALNHDSLSPAIQRQGKVVSKSSAVSAADAPNQRQQFTTPLTNHTTPAPSCQISTLTPTVISPENINQAETYAENDQVADDEFINIFSTPVQDQKETSSRHVDSSNMHTVYQRCPLSLHQREGRKRDGENLDKMKEKGDECIFVGYSNQSRAYRTMASIQISSDPAPECQTMALKHDSLSPRRKCQENVSHGDKTGTTSNELDLLFSPMFDELLNGSSKVVSKSSVVSDVDESIQRQHQPTTPLNNHTTPAPTCQNPSIASSVTSNEN